MKQQLKTIHAALYRGSSGLGEGQEWPKVRFGYAIRRQVRGVLAQLPPWSDEEPDLSTLKARNVFKVKVTAKNEVLVRGAKEEISNLTERTKRFIMNPDQEDYLAESPKVAIISLKNDRNTSYEVYLEVFNALKQAYLDLWEEKSQELYGLPYSEDLSIDKRRAIKQAIPMVLSEAEPTSLVE